MQKKTRKTLLKNAIDLQITKIQISIRNRDESFEHSNKSFAGGLVTHRIIYLLEGIFFCGAKYACSTSQLKNLKVKSIN